MCVALQPLFYPFSLRPTSLINNCLNPPLILQTIALFVCVFVRVLHAEGPSHPFTRLVELLSPSVAHSDQR